MLKVVRRTPIVVYFINTVHFFWKVVVSLRPDCHNLFLCIFCIAGLSLLEYSGLKPIDPAYALPVSVVNKVILPCRPWFWCIIAFGMKLPKCLALEGRWLVLLELKHCFCHHGWIYIRILGKLTSSRVLVQPVFWLKFEKQFNIHTIFPLPYFCIFWGSWLRDSHVLGCMSWWVKHHVLL